jgi:glycosyltransferase involved in cell wall biosynthesis
MKIGFVTCHYPPDSVGGGQMQSMRLCKALAEKHEVTVFTRSYDRQLQATERYGNYILHRRKTVRIPGVKSIVDLLTVIRQIKRAKNEINVYLSFHIQLAALMVIIAKKLYGIKAVVSPRGFEDFDFKGIKKKFQQYIYNRADIILIQSEGIREAFLDNARKHFTTDVVRRFEKKIRIFPNGILVPEARPSKVSVRSEQIVFVGRLERIKGVDNLIEAFRKCNTRVRLLIVGEGSIQEELEKQAAGLNIVFAGRQDEKQINEILSQSRLLVLPSLSENFPNVILEAFCAGVPVIASSVGAIPELVKDDVTGYKVPPADVEALADRINKILGEEEKLDEMGECAYQEVSKYDWKNLVAQFDKVIS